MAAGGRPRRREGEKGGRGFAIEKQRRRRLIREITRAIVSLSFVLQEVARNGRDRVAPVLWHSRCRSSEEGEREEDRESLNASVAEWD